MSATSITLSSLSSLSIESINEEREVQELDDTNEGNDLAEFENENDSGHQSKTTHRRSFLILFLLTIALILSVAIAIQASKSPTKTKFISTTTLFYNMTVPPTEFITSTPETSFCGDPLWISDGQCDDESNKLDCHYDGGDCCLTNANLTICIKCICHLTGHRQNQTQSNERVLAVIGGRILESPNKDSSTEVIFESKNNTHHQFFASYPYDRVETCGGLVDNRIIVCGGIEGNDFGYWDIWDHNSDFLWDTISSECYQFDPIYNLWEVIHVMDKPRIQAASIVIDGKLWITGGRVGEYFNFKSSSEFVDPKQPNTFLKGPDMPFEIKVIWLHCLARLSSHQVMLIGGTIVDKHGNVTNTSNKTFVYDFLVNAWTSGPEMSVGRANHACTSFTDKDDINWTIVSGGVFSWPNKYTEMLEENSSEWTYMEMNDPYANRDPNLINFMGKTMLFEGIATKHCGLQCVRKSSTDIYELVKSANGQFEWTLSDLSLLYQRTTTFTVLDVPLESINS